MKGLKPNGWLMATLGLTSLVTGILLTGRFAVRAETKSTAVAPRPKGTITYTKDIAPIFYQSCTTCHRSGEVAPFTLASYKDAKKRAEQIALVTEQKVMPPWKADSHGEFQDERRLTPAQIALIKQWAAEGAKEGKASDLPPAPNFPPGWTLGKPDMILQPTEDYKVEAEGRDVYRCFVIPTDFKEDRYVSAIDVHPGNRATVHHIIAYLDTSGKARKLDAQDPGPGYSTFGGVGFMPAGTLGGWAPGATARYLPANTGILLPKGADVVLQVHYHKDGKPETDRSQVGVYFNKGVVDKPYHISMLINFLLSVPANEKNYEVHANLPVPKDATLLTIAPHMHLIGKNMTVTADLPDGTTKQLINVPDWDFNWQGFYLYKDPVKLPHGTKLHMVAHFDNSTSNPRNPSNPPKTVTWGEQTTDEMCIAFLGYTLDSEHLHPDEKAANR